MTNENTVAYGRLLFLLEAIITCITRSTPKPEIENFPHDRLITLRVDARDQGRVIGKKGLNIWALQTIFWYAGYAQLVGPYSLKLFEPQQPCRNISVPTKFNPKWDREKIKIMLAAISETCLSAHGHFRLDETDETTAAVFFRIEKYLQTPMSDPDFTEALSAIVRAAGMIQGASLKTEVSFQ